MCDVCKTPASNRGFFCAHENWLPLRTVNTFVDKPGITIFVNECSPDPAWSRTAEVLSTKVAPVAAQRAFVLPGVKWCEALFNYLYYLLNKLCQPMLAAGPIFQTFLNFFLK